MMRMNLVDGNMRHGNPLGSENDTETNCRYVVAARAKIDAFLRELKSRYPTRPHTPARLEQTYLDTFDRRLAKKGLTLSALHTAGETRLVLESAVGTEHLPLTGGLPAFAADLPAGSIRQRIHSVIEPRRLLALVRVAGQSQTINILDKRLTTSSFLRYLVDAEKPVGLLVVAVNNFVTDWARTRVMQIPLDGTEDERPDDGPSLEEQYELSERLIEKLSS